MPFAQLHWPSRTLGRSVTTWVLLPDVDAGPPPFPTLYLLHGLSDDHTAWVRNTRVERHVAGRPLIVVMPDGGRGFYADHPGGGPRWAEHVGVELPTMIERTFPARADRAGRFVGGLSMGGYGACRLALGYPDRFASAHSHSGAVAGPRRSPEYQHLFGPDGSSVAGTGHDLLALAAARDAGRLPRLRLDCGTDDFLLADNRVFAAGLTAAGVPHVYAEHPGGHTWDYWDRHVGPAIDWHLSAGD